MEPPTQLTLTGKVYGPNDEYQEEIPEESVIETDLGTIDLAEIPVLAPGDVVLKTLLDHRGRLARSMGHTNLGFSGNVVPLIWDGNETRAFHTRDVLEYSDIHYEKQEDAPEALDRVATKLKRLRDQIVEYKIPPSKKRRAFVLAQIN